MSEHHGHDHHDHQHGGGTATVTDPVCGMQVDPATAPATREHEGVSYAFCAPGCAKAFDADPARYTGAA